MNPTSSSRLPFFPSGAPTLTATSWAEHVLDLRVDQSEPLTSHDSHVLPGLFGQCEFDAIHNRDPELAHLDGWRVEFHNPSWPNETGYEAAIFVPPAAGAPRAAVVYQDNPASPVTARVENKTIAKDHLGLPRTIGKRLGTITADAARIPAAHAAIVDPTIWLGPINLDDAQDPSVVDPSALRSLPLWASPQFPTWADARPWASAGFTTVHDALTWKAAFDDAGTAAQWKSATIGWPDQCRALADAGWTALEGKRLSLILTNNALVLGVNRPTWSGTMKDAIDVLIDVTSPSHPHRADPQKVLMCLHAGMETHEIAQLAKHGELDGLEDSVLSGMGAIRRRVDQRR